MIIWIYGYIPHMSDYLFPLTHVTRNDNEGKRWSEIWTISSCVLSNLILIATIWKGIYNIVPDHLSRAVDSAGITRQWYVKHPNLVLEQRPALTRAVASITVSVDPSELSNNIE